MATGRVKGDGGQGRSSPARTSPSDRRRSPRPKARRRRTISSSTDLAAQTRRVLRVLDRLYPRSRCSLDHRSPFELLVATILSAQCTDARVNAVTPELFRRAPTPAAMARLSQADLEELVRSTGFFRNKAKAILGASRELVAVHRSQVPASMEALLALPGVARKTANVVLGTAFGVPSGVVVDTHVHRISRLLGLSREKDPAKVERDLMAIIPERHWIRFSHQMIDHGRQVCIANRPRCGQCGLRALCPSAQD